jgi:hypothetical protein
MYWRDFGQCSFAIKELNLTDRHLNYPVDVFRFERAAFIAGVPMPEPVSASDDSVPSAGHGTAGRGWALESP